MRIDPRRSAGGQSVENPSPINGTKSQIFTTRCSSCAPSFVRPVTGAFYIISLMRQTPRSAPTGNLLDLVVKIIRLVPGRKGNSRPEAAIRFFYSMTSSARTKTAGGIVRLIFAAAFRLMMSSNLVGW